MSKKLDELMSILLDYMQSKIDPSFPSKQIWSPSKALSQEEMIEIYREIGKLFFEVILKNQTCFMVHFFYILLCGQCTYPRIQ